MRRVLAIHLRSLSIDLAQRRRRRAARRPGAAPTSCVLLTRADHGRTLVAARCNEAARRGVRVGLSLAEAQALIDPRVRARHGDPWVEGLSPERDLRQVSRRPTPADLFEKDLQRFVVELDRLLLHNVFLSMQVCSAARIRCSAVLTPFSRMPTAPATSARDRPSP